MTGTTDHGNVRSGAFASPLTAAAIAAAALVAQHVLGKALRDALFLSHWPATRLPIVMTASTALSSPTVVLVGRLISRHGPARVIRPVFALHAAALAIEWLLAREWEPLVAVVVYLHTACLGAIILSAFWSVVSEAFDPHSGKRAIGRIAGGAALGGVVGGGLAWGGSHLVPLPTMLLAAAALSLLSMWGVQQLTVAAGELREDTDGDPRPSGFALLSNTPYLRMLAGLVVAGAMLQALLDYQLGAQAKEAFGSGARLLSFFAIFQTVVGLASFLLQVTANRPVLERLGIGGTIGLLPLVVGGAGISGLAAPSLITAVLQRGAEGMLRGSLFRSAYEVLFTPLPKALKRPTKLFIDVSLDRLGGLVGGGLTMALLASWPAASQRVVTMAAVILAAIQLLFAFGLHRGYVATLTERLRTGALQLDPASVVDATTRKTLSRTMSTLDRATLLAKIGELRNEQSAARDPPSPDRAAATQESPPPASRPPDDVVHAMTLLRSGDLAAIREALRKDHALSPLLVPQVIDLLGHEGVAREAMHALSVAAPGTVGAILDAVLDERRDARVRRRAARLLRNVPSQRVVEGLVFGLAVESFDVRHSCARVLVALKEKNEELHFDAPAMFERARLELEAASPDPRALEHAFDLLSLAGPREAMQLAYGALLSQDVFLRGVAREYLDVVLPVEVRTAMALRLSSPLPPASSPRASDRSLSDLLKSGDAIRQRLDEVRRTQDPDGEAFS
jgi:hypothetical protein